MRLIPYMRRNSLAEYRRRRQAALDEFWRVIFWWVPR